MTPLSVVAIDDDADQLILLEALLKKLGHEVFTAEGGETGFALVRRHAIDLVLTDYRMPGWDGARVLREVKALNPEVDVVMMTAFGNVEAAVEVMKQGAYDYLTKPLDFDEVDNLLRRVQERRALVQENLLLKQALHRRFQFDAIISQSGKMEEVLSTASRAAASKATILVRGESGTGKELVARAIHYASPRRNRPFVVVNMAALSENLLESELFGHEKGAFTGASQRRIGRFEQADGGTLFIDEVGDVPLTVQVKLLRAIQFGQVERLGSSKTIDIDVRIVAATHRDLEAMMAAGVFRTDLYYRLNVVAIGLPPLRARKEDIPVLVEHFIQKFAEENGRAIKGITRPALDRLMKYAFPGNVRELQNVVERAVVLARHEHLTIDDLPAQVAGAQARAILDPFHLDEGYAAKMHAFERALLEEALERSDGNKSAAARLLGISERHIRSRLKKLEAALEDTNG